MTLQEFYIVTPSGERRYFSDIKLANEAAQSQANTTGESVARYDIHGGLSLFKPTQAGRTASEYGKR